MYEGLDVIGMLKKTLKRFYQYKGNNYSFKTLSIYYNLNQNDLVHRERRVGFIQIKLNNTILAKIIFIHHRKYKKEWLAFPSTNTSLSYEEIIRS